MRQINSYADMNPVPTYHKRYILGDYYWRMDVCIIDTAVADQYGPDKFNQRLVLWSSNPKLKGCFLALKNIHFHADHDDLEELKSIAFLHVL